jgi:hypothetical protein
MSAASTTGDEQDNEARQYGVADRSNDRYRSHDRRSSHWVHVKRPRGFHQPGEYERGERRHTTHDFHGVTPSRKKIAFYSLERDPFIE